MILIRTNGGRGRPYEFNVELTTTVKELKQLTRKKTNDDEDALKNMYFTFDEDILDENDETLASYGVEEESELDLRYSNIKGRNLGALGTRFADVNNSKGLKRCAWSQTAPRWRRTRHGLCLEGTCSNTECEAHNHNVIIPVGYKKFDILCDPDDTTTVCPVCKNFVQPTNCGFNNCWWKFQGIKQEGDDNRKAPKRCSSEWTQADNAYHYFDQLTSGTVTWKQLVLEAVKNKPAS
ncbi:unnamed protein product [Rotaria sp. Silwood2]|nr:unnamed protein product [Rotaria sp. Silwood2]CAF4691204.1 unnamed protein product [Rotaria sp. Silwood2]